MRALFGLDPDGDRALDRRRGLFEKALSFYSTDYLLRMLRGPAHPWARLQRPPASSTT